MRRVKRIFGVVLLVLAISPVGAQAQGEPGGCDPTSAMINLAEIYSDPTHTTPSVTPPDPFECVNSLLAPVTQWIADCATDPEACS